MGNPFKRESMSNVGHGPAVVCSGSWKAALNKVLSITLSLVLVLTMSPISTTQALAAEKYGEANRAGGGFLAS